MTVFVVTDVFGDRTQGVNAMSKSGLVTEHHSESEGEPIVACWAFPS